MYTYVYVLNIYIYICTHTYIYLLFEAFLIKFFENKSESNDKKRTERISWEVDSSCVLYFFLTRNFLVAVTAKATEKIGKKTDQKRFV